MLGETPQQHFHIKIDTTSSLQMESNTQPQIFSNRKYYCPIQVKVYMIVSENQLIWNEDKMKIQYHKRV